MLSVFSEKIAELTKSIFAEEEPSEKIKKSVLPPSIKKQREMVSNHLLSDLLPYEFYDEKNRLFFTDESYGFGYQITPLTGMDENMVGNLANLFSHGMKKGVIIQVSLVSSPDIMESLTEWANARKYEHTDKSNNRKQGIYRDLARKRVEYLMSGRWKSLFSDQAMLLRDFQIVFTLMLPRKKKGIDLTPGEIAEIERLRNATSGGLVSANIQFKALEESYFINFIHKILNPVPLRRGDIQIDSLLPMNEQVVDPSTALYVGRDSLVINTKSVDEEEFTLDVRCFKVKSFPVKGWAGWNNTLLIGHPTDNNRRIPSHYMVTLTISYPDQLNQLAHAKTKAMRSGQMAKNMGDLVPSWAQKKADWSFVVAKLEEGHTMAKMNYQVVLFSLPEFADYSEHQLISVYRSAGFRLVRERFTTLHAFMNALPMAATPSLVEDAIKLKRFRTLLTWSAANLAPLIGEWKGTGSPFLQLIGRRGQLCNVDPLDNQQGNYNIAIAAASGSGKSFLGQEIVKCTLEQNGKVWLFDRGRSFQNINNMLGGEYLVFSKGKGISINPFSDIKSWEGDEDTGSEKLMIRDLIIQMASFHHPVKSYHIGWVEQALQKAWESEGYDAEITTVYNILMGDNTENRSEKRLLADSFFSFTRDGAQGEFFTGKSNIQLNNDFIGLEMQDLDPMPQLQGVVVLMLILKITQEFYNQKDRQRRKVCLIDEAWKLMKGDAGDFIEEGYRTARKFSGSFITITQGVNEYYNNPVTQACWENSDWKYLLRQNSDSLKFLKKQDRLPGGDVAFDILESLETRHGYYSEVAIISPSGITAPRLIIDPFHEKLYSTKGHEFAYIQQLQEQGMDLVSAIDEAVKKFARY